MSRKPPSELRMEAKRCVLDEVATRQWMSSASRKSSSSNRLRWHSNPWLFSNQAMPRRNGAQEKDLGIFLVLFPQEFHYICVPSKSVRCGSRTSFSLSKILPGLERSEKEAAGDTTPSAGLSPERQG